MTKPKVRPEKIFAIYGQENDLATWALAKMNMFLHDCPSAEIWKGNTLASPHFTEKSGLKTFDFAVANPPFSSKAWSNGVNTEHDPFGRFAFGVPPPKNGDYAFLLHVLASLKSTGKGAIIMPHGVLFRGNVEADRQACRRRAIGAGPGLTVANRAHQATGETLCQAPSETHRRC